MRTPVFAIYYPRGAVPEDGEAVPQAAPPPEPVQPPPAAVPTAIAEAVSELLNAPLRAPAAAPTAAQPAPLEPVAKPSPPREDAVAAPPSKPEARPEPEVPARQAEAEVAPGPNLVSGLAAGADLPASPTPDAAAPPSAAAAVSEAAPSPRAVAAPPADADATTSAPRPAPVPEPAAPATDVPVAAVPAAALPGADAPAVTSAMVIALVTEDAVEDAPPVPEPGPEFDPGPAPVAEGVPPPEAPPQPAAALPPSPDVMPQFRVASAGPVQGPHLDGLPHEVLGLFAPEVMTVRARVGAADWAGMDQPRAGLYRPEGFRPAPWNGLAYDVAPADGRGVGAGARVLTARGEVPVEELVPHDRVLGLRGPRLAEVAWIGRRSLPPAQGDAAPVRVPAGALGEDQPAQDVIVGPDQTLFPDGATPVPARELVRTGAAMRAEGQETELFQVALRPYPGSEGGDVLLVEGIFAATRGGQAER